MHHDDKPAQSKQEYSGELSERRRKRELELEEKKRQQKLHSEHLALIAEYRKELTTLKAQ